MPELQALFEDAARTGALTVILQIGLIVVATIIALRFAHGTVSAALDRLFDREVVEGTAQDVSAIEVERRRVTLDGLVYRALRVIILIIAFLMTLQVLRLDIGPAIAGLGIIGLALGLGAQHLVSDYVAGAFVIIENQYAKGDVVSIADVTGTVEDISLRRTTLRDLDGTLHYVRHGLIGTASNQTRTWARVNLDLPVPYGIDIDSITRVVNAAGQQLATHPQWKGRVLEPPTMVRIERINEYGMTVKILGSVRAVDRWEAAGEMRRLIIDGAASEGLKIGWPIDASESIPVQVDPEVESRRQRADVITGG